MPNPKPAKPYESFPLGPHSSGKWVKKIRGRHYYFGRLADPDGALREYNAIKDALAAGREPVVTDPNIVTVKELFNAFLDRQLRRVDAGRMEARSYQDQKAALAEFALKVGTGRIVSDLRPADFGAARDSFTAHLGPHALNRTIANVRAAFNWADKNGKITCKITYGDQFDKESARVQRRTAREATYARGKKLFTPRDCRAVVKAADAPLRAMVLLGLNAGFYAIDIASLPFAAVDLDDAWLEFPRTKTEVMRAVPLWPETVKAIRDAIKLRGKPRNPADAGTVFLTKRGNRYVHVAVTRDEEGIKKASRSDAVSQAFRKLLIALDIRRPGISFSALRHTFRTIADEIGDNNAVALMMGHAFKGMDAFYVRDVARPRLERVANHVRAKLLNPKQISPRTKASANTRRKRR